MDVEQLTLVGGHPVLDLVNSVERGVPAPGTEPRDFLGTGADLVRWAERTGVVSPTEAAAVRSAGDPDGRPAELGRVRRLREAVHAILLARLGLRPWADGEVAAALELLAERRAEAAGRSRLRLDAGGALVREVGTDPGRLIGDRLADAAVDLVTGADVERVRRCPVEQGGCGWVFLDRSKNRSRTWCRMEDCGSTVKARRLTERRRQARTAGEQR
jgi:predicted RNA-binding Zn ribbon-like protein